MNIWIDICHIPQFNFFKPLITELAQRGDLVYVTVLNRGKTAMIMRHELEGVENVQMYVIGKHRMNKFSAIIDANIIRMLKLMYWILNKHIDVALSTNIFTSFLGWLFRIRNYSYGDDPQVFDLRPNSRFATKAHMCIYEWTLEETKPKRTIILPCLKEWAYLNPRTFKPNEKVLEKYGMKPKEYIFLREVTVGTVNYAGQESGAILGIKAIIPKGMKVLFSLEEKKRRDEYPADWILLQEPIEDIHSLIYYSAGLVSSGDSMAREAALLGVPAYYLGIRYSMPANAAASKVASLQNRKTMPFETWIDSLPTDVQECEKRQKELRAHIDNEFIDINQYMLKLVEDIAQNKSSK
ncbi:MAG: DUF354 domain-containing protein [Paludibacteraceae bacterium]|nr:DUF354 domain-containing protein [Paludibacteraceae bacterium]